MQPNEGEKYLFYIWQAYMLLDRNILWLILLANLNYIARHPDTDSTINMVQKCVNVKQPSTLDSFTNGCHCPRAMT